MRSTPSALDSSAKRWLIFLAVTVLAGGAIAIYSFFIRENSATQQQASPVTASVETATSQTVSSEPPSPFSEANFPSFISPEVKAEIRKEMINKQADYLKELPSKYSNTPSLATPEEVEEMRKSGRMAW